MDKGNVQKSGSEVAFSHTTAILRIPGVLRVFSVLDVADCVLVKERAVTIAKKKDGRKQEGWCLSALHFWRLSLSVL